MPLLNAFNFSLYVCLIEHASILFVLFFLLNMEFQMLGVMIMIVVKMFIDY